MPDVTGVSQIGTFDCSDHPYPIQVLLEDSNGEMIMAGGLAKMDHAAVKELDVQSGKYKNVSELMKARPELKIKEFSKQYVRDALLEMGFKPETAKVAPKLSKEHVHMLH